ncbi:hypothetical protein FHX82_006383 [Amycolatopsis bartoniae]|uniref:Uncharacterized protein n=1 Tax=Amycolatopsis bartoniae TaxID=941986 RepID=A0A8H9M827_9PSEU|nr:DUF6297 family protein [Amycolatopsis bartoniae]MBB2939297.1 hypothetical protein [Amycolatopsis bartoniae]TVT08751.1 hypothetical protein FNH07_11555 [Amycolatopsis bartoniae]GHF37495.1 hypothetical protein GCM10017566_08340 [Amycolatopsis bartoniae]
MKRSSGDLAAWVLGGALVAGFLSIPLSHTAELRAQLLGTHPAPSWGGLAVLGLGLLLATRSVLHKGFAWADPAQLTWADFDGSRPALLRRRLLLAWLGRFGAAAYVVLATGTLLGFSWPVLEITAFATVAAGTLAAAAPAVRSGRAELVRRYRERLVRRTALTFLDVLALLPAGQPVRWPGALAGHAVVARFALAVILSRRRSLPTAGLLAAAVALAHALFPAVDPAWWLGLGGYCAALPFASALAELTRSPGLRRWIGRGDREVRATAAAVLVLFLALWEGLAVALGVSVSAAGVTALVVAAAAVVRTATRAGVDYGNLGTTAVAGILVPAGLLWQVGHGPDLLVVCLVLLLVSGIALAVPLSLGLSAAAVLRT